jgi:formate hydrogenlyase subunit 4
MIELAASLKLLVYLSLIVAIFVPWGIAATGDGVGAHLAGGAVYLAKLTVAGLVLSVFETAIAKMRVFRVPEFLAMALMLGLLGTLLRFVSRTL